VFANQQSALWWGSTSTVGKKTPAGRPSLVWKVNDSCSIFCGKFGFLIFISHDGMKVSPEGTILERSVFLISTVPQGIRSYVTICRFCTQRAVQVFKVWWSKFRKAWTFVNNETRVSASLNAEQRGSWPVASSYSAILQRGEYNLTTASNFWWL